MFSLLPNCMLNVLHKGGWEEQLQIIWNESKKFQKKLANNVHTNTRLALTAGYISQIF